MSLLTYFFCCIYVLQQILGGVKVARGNRRFLLKSVIFFIGSEMCLMCAHHKKFLSQNKVHNYVLFWCNYHLFIILTHKNIWDQNLGRSKFCCWTTFDPRIIYAYFMDFFFKATVHKWARRGINNCPNDMNCRALKKGGLGASFELYSGLSSCLSTFYFGSYIKPFS